MSRVVAVVVALLLGGCVTPATGSDSYRDKAVTSVRAATSEVATALMSVRLQLSDDILEPYADETVTANEKALGSISAAFGSVQPPAGDDDVHDEISALLTDAEGAVTAARIATRRADEAGLREARRELRAVRSDLADAEERLQ